MSGEIQRYTIEPVVHDGKLAGLLVNPDDAGAWMGSTAVINQRAIDAATIKTQGEMIANLRRFVTYVQARLTHGPDANPNDGLLDDCKRLLSAPDAKIIAGLAQKNEQLRGALEQALASVTKHLDRAAFAASVLPDEKRMLAHARAVLDQAQ